MIIDPNWKRIAYSKFGGAVTSIQEEKVAPPNLAQCRNFTFAPDGLYPRTGYKELGANQPIVSAEGWITAFGRFVLIYDPAYGVKILDLSSPSTYGDLISNTGKTGAKFANTGNFAYVSYHDSTQLGVGSGKVVCKVGVLFHADDLFPAPMTTAFGSVTEPGSGEITAGSHNLAYLVRYRHGATLQLSPHSSSSVPPTPATLLPKSFTATGGANASVSITATWPSDAVGVYLCMTPKHNSALYLEVPSSYQAVTGGATSSITFTWSISDESLMAAADEDSELQHSKRLLLLTKATQGAAPFAPHNFVAYGERLLYLTTQLDASGQKEGFVYASNRNRWQEIYSNKSFLRLKSKGIILCGQEMDGEVHLFGPSVTQAARDNLSDPVAWSTRVSSNAIGTQSINGISYNNDLRVIFVAHTSGLYAYNGAYPANPLSYWNDDLWQQINWNYPHLVQVVDDPEKKVVHVVAAINGSSSVNAWWTWDYREGTAHNKVRFSDRTMALYAVRGLVLVKNTATSNSLAYDKSEVWAFTAASGKIRYPKTTGDTDLYKDGTAAIDYLIQPAFPPASTDAKKMLHGWSGNVAGEGELTSQLVNKAGTRAIDLATLMLEEDNTESVSRQGSIVDAFPGVVIQMNTAGHYFRLTDLELYWSVYSNV